MVVVYIYTMKTEFNLADDAVAALEGAGFVVTSDNSCFGDIFFAHPDGQRVRLFRHRNQWIVRAAVR